MSDRLTSAIILPWGLRLHRGLRLHKVSAECRRRGLGSHSGFGMHTVSAGCVNIGAAVLPVEGREISLFLSLPLSPSISPFVWLSRSQGMRVSFRTRLVR